MNKENLKKLSLFCLIAIIIIIILSLIACRRERAHSGTATEEDILTVETSKEQVEVIKEEDESKLETEKDSSSIDASKDSSVLKEESGSASANSSIPENSSTVESSSAVNDHVDENAGSTTEESHTVPDNAGQNSSAVQTPANNSSQPVNSTPANDSSQPVNSTPANDSSQPTNSTPANDSSQPVNSTPANDSSQPTNSTPANNSSQTTQACNHNWSSRLVTIHHDPEYADEPIYGTKQGVIEEAWDEITGYRYGYITSDGTVFFIDDYGSVSSCVAALTVYCTDNNRSYSTYDQPIYVHHDAVYGDVTDYDNIVGYQKVEVVPAWDEQTFEYYCTKCGEILN